MASDQEIIKLANGFLMNAPPGEFMEVVTDVRTLLPNETMLNDTAPATFKKYNEEQMIQASLPDNKDKKFLVCKYAEVGENEYVDYANGLVHKFDHIKQQVLSSRPISETPDNEPVRAALEKALAQYVNEQYPFGTCGVYVNKKEGVFVLCINSTRLNPHNFWNGRWRSVWKVPMGKSGKVTLNGHIRLQVHYYEDGNVQLNTDTERKVQAEDGSPQGIVKTIVKTEQTFHQNLDSSYNLMGETTCKALRRALPITNSKINWNLIKNYRVGQDVARK